MALLKIVEGEIQQCESGLHEQRELSVKYQVSLSLIVSLFINY